MLGNNIEKDIQRRTIKLTDLIEKGKIDEAFQPATAVLEDAREKLGENHLDYAQSLDNLAFLYYSKRSYEKAEPLLKQVLQIWKKTLGEDHQDYAASLNNLAMLYQSMGAYKEAEPLKLPKKTEIKHSAISSV
jgi:tetratricopeptide (TPR) repeat protein